MSASDKKRVVLLLLGIIFFCWPVIFFPAEAWPIILLLFSAGIIPVVGIGYLSRKYKLFQTSQAKAYLTFLSIGIISFILSNTMFRNTHYSGRDTLFRSLFFSFITVFISVIAYLVSLLGKKLIAAHKRKE